jgi:drug/metabolite transporter (DMT)-like permease
VFSIKDTVDESIADAAPRCAELSGRCLHDRSDGRLCHRGCLPEAVAASLPVSQILMLSGSMGVMVFSLLAIQAHEAPLPRNILSPLILARSLSEIVGRLFYMLAIALTPLSTASAILQATPLVVLGCAGLFGERVSARRWL